MKHRDIKPSHQDLMKGIGQKLTKLRTVKGISSSAMAKTIGVSRNGYHLLEEGNVYFNFSTFLQVLDYHKISVSDFFRDIDL